MVVRKGSIDKFLMFLLLAYSGNPFFSIGEGVGQYTFVIITLLMSVIFVRYFNNELSRYFYLYLLFFVAVFCFQYLILGFVSVTGALGFLIKITFAYLVISYIGFNFRQTYLNIMFFISIISLGGYLLNISGYNLPGTIYEKGITKSIILFTQVGDGFRNSGMFWEPGAFAAYLNLGLLFYLGQFRELLLNHKNKLIIIVLALLTTFSTSGYLVLFGVIIATLIFEVGKKYHVLIIPVLLIMSLILYNVFVSVDFLGQKIEHQYSNIYERSPNEFSPDRFGALYFDLHYIEKNPITGNGLHSSTRYADHPWLIGQNLGHGNGFSNFIASMGILSIIFYIYFLLKFNLYHPWIFLLGVLALLQGEQLMNYPLFLSLPFIFIYEYNFSRFNDMPQQEAENHQLYYSSL